MALSALGSFVALEEIPYLRTRVFNIAEQKELEQNDLTGFVQQNPSAVKLVEFRQHHTGHLFPPDADEMAKAVAVQHWVRSQEGDNPAQGRMVDGTEDPEEYLQAQQRGVPSACRRFSYILVGSLLSVGVHARLVAVSSVLDRNSSEAHVLVEIRLQSPIRWVLLDPTFDAFVLVDGRPASLLEVFDASQPGSHGIISFNQHGSHYRLPTADYYRSMFRHLFISRTNAIFDGYRYGVFVRHRIEFIHYFAPGIQPYPETRKELLLATLGISTGFVVFLSLQIFLGGLRRDVRK